MTPAFICYNVAMFKGHPIRRDTTYATLAAALGLLETYTVGGDDSDMLEAGIYLHHNGRHEMIEMWPEEMIDLTARDD